MNVRYQIPNGVPSFKCEARYHIRQKYSYLAGAQIPRNVYHFCPMYV